MNTTTLKERLGLDEEAVFEDGVTATDDGMTDEELKIESLKMLWREFLFTDRVLCIL